MEKQGQTRHGGLIESNRWRWYLNLGDMEPGIHQGTSCAVLSACSEHFLFSSELGSHRSERNGRFLELGIHLPHKLVSSIIENFVDTWILL